MAEQTRQVAKKVRISDVKSGQYVRKEGWDPNVIVLDNGTQFSRANIIGVVVSISTEENNYQEAIIDDGTESIAARSFENNDIFSNIKVGDFALLIGKPREYGSERYLVPEIIKSIDKRWAEVRKLELGPAPQQPSTPIPTQSPTEPTQQKPIEEPKAIITEETIETAKLTSEQVYNTIKEIDSGEGADRSQIISKLGNDAEPIILNLLSEGEIFEPKPGKLKVLD